MKTRSLAGMSQLELPTSHLLILRCWERNTKIISLSEILIMVISFFEVNEERTGLRFDDSRLFDLVADPVLDDSPTEVSSVLFGSGIGRITDIEIRRWLGVCAYARRWQDLQNIKRSINLEQDP
jgi:hypothetical protein